MGIISPIKKKCTVLKCKNYCSKNRSFCEKHKKQKSRGKSLTLKKGEEFKAVGRPLLDIDEVKFPEKKLQREKKLLEKRIPINLLCDEILEPEDAALDKQLVDNLASFLHEIPASSGIRESIVNGISSGIGVRPIARRLSISAETAQRAKSLKTNNLIKIKSKNQTPLNMLHARTFFLSSSVSKSSNKK